MARRESSSNGENSRENALAAYRRGDPDALELLEIALGEAPRDGELLITHAAVATATGASEPFSRIEHILSQAPDWVDGQKALARLKTEFGHDLSLATIEHALERLPKHPKLWMAYIGLLGARGQHETAAGKVSQLRRKIGDMPVLQLLEARHVGFAGRCDEAQFLLEALSNDVPELQYELARNSLRLGRLDQAANAINLGLRDNPIDVGLWALAELCWRAMGDVRWREEPEIIELFIALERELLGYASKLRELGEGHPLAPLSSRKPQIRASWSIQLESEGFHVSHLHNSGLISSAAHLKVPDNLKPGEGALELGRPPSDIALPIEPIAKFDALPGHIVLFPSFLYHGTSKFRVGRRLTVAFDAA